MTRKRRPSPQTRTVLAALLGGSGQWRYGYELSKETGLASGTLYPAMMRLADRGFLETKWETSIEGRPPRHLYRLTTSGAAYARDAGSERSDVPSHLRPVAEIP
jgi:PadR family transcriptional regulator PadR